eukprot:CAMPEP_0201946432 /NCGR_PEP_ID=MMETSP0903-20130614/54417_1 /ASSEMBLY_ACC=CAM_ASM_000552 /TAXON_ID=420261 /ORGANISM="Thalassiosira antarctica, Strain CCMP982" /LENGTH=318 /DNA_ID=CAMNT_0048489533 /DNA_START=57 /DNA_END=1013 /DNA_ORIENTATION=-
MMLSFSTCRLVVLFASACNAVTSAETEPVVDLGFAGEYAILSKSGISATAGSKIYGDIAVSPIASTAMTGFDLTLDSSTQFSKSALIVAGPDASLGEAYAASYGGDSPIASTAMTGFDLTLDSSTQFSKSALIVAGPDASLGEAYAASYGGEIANVLTTAVGAMETAYTDAAGRSTTDADTLNLGGGILGGEFGGPTKPLTPGVYTFGTDVYLNSDVHFSGDGVYIIQISGDLVQAEDKKVILDLDAAKPEKIFWQVAGHVEVGVGAQMKGIILAKTKVDFKTNSSLNGRVLTQTACNLQSATITEPVPTARRGLRSM